MNLSHKTRRKNHQGKANSKFEHWFTMPTIPLDRQTASTASRPYWFPFHFCLKNYFQSVCNNFTTINQILIQNLLSFENCFQNKYFRKQRKEEEMAGSCFLIPFFSFLRALFKCSRDKLLKNRNVLRLQTLSKRSNKWKKTENHFWKQ